MCSVVDVLMSCIPTILLLERGSLSAPLNTTGLKFKQRKMNKIDDKKILIPSLGAIVEIQHIKQHRRMSRRRRLVESDSEDDVVESSDARLRRGAKDEEEFELQDGSSGSNGSLDERSSGGEEEEAQPVVTRRSKRAASTAARGKMRRAVEASNYSLDSENSDEEDQGEVTVMQTPKTKRKQDHVSSSSSQTRSSSRIHAVSAKKQAKARSKFGALVADLNDKSLKQEKQRRKRQRGTLTLGI